MRRLVHSLAAAVVLAVVVPPLLAAEQNASPAPDFKEVYDLVREHLSEVSEASLNQSAVQGLLSGLTPKVSLVKPGTPGGAAEVALVSKTDLFDGRIGYLRVGRVAEGLAPALEQGWKQLSATNALNGLVLDLRFADGRDYAAAVAAADLFLSKEKPLLDWGQGLVQSKEKADAVTAPIAILVNRQTAGAAEALAAVLRQAGPALILGSRTAGQAMVAQEYPLKNGERLRIMTAPIRLGDGSELSPEGVKPDISVAVSPQAERLYFADAFKELSRTNPTGGSGLSSTNLAPAVSRARRPRFNEAELVRERREGYAPDADGSEGADADVDAGLVRDPALARAIDVLKGLALVRPRNP